MSDFKIQLYGSLDISKTFKNHGIVVCHPRWTLCFPHFQKTQVPSLAAKARLSGILCRFVGDLGGGSYQGETNIATENGHLWWTYLVKMVIFHSSVSLPEGSKPKLMVIDTIM